MDSRFTERVNTESGDFVVRRGPLLWPLLIIFLTAFGALLFTGTGIGETGSWPFIITLMLVIGILAAFTVIYTQRQRDLVTHAEFQNAMFASAASMAGRFSMILKRDGAVVYSDPGFKSLFPEMGRGETGSLNVLLQRGWLERDAFDALLKGLEQQRREQVVTSITMSGNPLKCVVTLEPLPKPKGYFVLRGREYVHREGKDKATTTLPALLTEALLQDIPAAAYLVDTHGSIIFATPAMEQMLGYDNGELTSLRMMLGYLFNPPVDPALQNLHTPFEGPVQLLRKDGSLVSATVSQRPVKNDAGLSAGCTGVLHADVSVDDIHKPHRW
jgi:PAS domain S-box-containing protein